jgi:hypothetical protein
MHRLQSWFAKSKGIHASLSGTHTDLALVSGMPFAGYQHSHVHMFTQQEYTCSGRLLGQCGGRTTVSCNSRCLIRLSIWLWTQGGEFHEPRGQSGDRGRRQYHAHRIIPRSDPKNGSQTGRRACACVRSVRHSSLRTGRFQHSNVSNAKR